MFEGKGLVTEDLGSFFRRAREMAGLTQEQLAKRIGTCVSVVYRVENNKYNPTLAFLDRYAKGLGVRIEIRFWLTP
jgi:HTH-type transcriptional regulator/antitoxin HipB